MADNSDKKYREAGDRLITEINLMKLRLEAKYGPAIKKRWTGKK